MKSLIILDIKSTFIKNKEFLKISKNFLFLFLVNIVNFILPILTFPYLVRVLGVEKFGLLSFATSIITYFLILTDYGFNVTATKEISINRNNKDKINEIFSAVISLKILIMIMGFVIMLPFIFFIPKLNDCWYIFIFTYGNVLGQLIYPVWFFQGIESMKLISILNIISKFIFTGAIFMFVNSEKDFYLVPVFSSLGYLLIGIISMLIVIFQYKICFVLQKKEVLYAYLVDGWSLFLSNISVTLYTTATITFLGFFSNNIVVGYYSVADKIISAIRGIVAPLAQVLFPYLCKISLENPNRVLLINKYLTFIGGTAMLLVSILLYVFAQDFIFFIFNKKDFASIIILKIMAIIPFLTFLHTVFALFTMLVFGKNKEYSRIILSAAIFNLFMCLGLIPYFDYIGAAIAVVLVEFYLLIRYVLFTETNDLKVLSFRNKTRL